MNRAEAFNQLKARHNINTVNARFLTAQQIVSLVSTGKVTLTAEELVAIFSERNERANKNQQLQQDNTKLSAELAKFRADGAAIRRFIKKNLIDMTDSELSELGYVRKEKAEKIIRLALDKTNEKLDNAERIVANVRKHK